MNSFFPDVRKMLRKYISLKTNNMEFVLLTDRTAFSYIV